MMDVESKDTREILDYWKSLKGDVYAPVRGDLDIRNIKALLPRVFLIGLDCSEWHFRLAGTAFYSLYGRELTGQSFGELWGASAAQIGSHLSPISYLACPIVVSSLSRCMGDVVRTETILLPMRSDRDFGEVDRYLGLQSFPRNPRPWRLGVRPFGGAEIVDIQQIKDEEDRTEIERRGREVPAIKVGKRSRGDYFALRVIEGGLGV